MRGINLILLVCMMLGTLSTATSCRRNSNLVWDDTKTAGRHMGRGIRALGGKRGCSREVWSKDAFCGDEIAAIGGSDDDFIPLADDPNAQELAMGEITRPPAESPGEPGSSLPGISAFRDPSTNYKYAGIFRNIHFGYNSSLVKGQENLEIVRDVAAYMQKNPRVYAFVEGHCDERGPEAYNLALGANRSNSVRNLLIKEGVNPDNIFTISYGKEKPLVLGHDEESWTQNRRAEFKIYER